MASSRHWLRRICWHTANIGHRSAALTTWIVIRMSELRTEPAPFATHPPVQRVVEVSGRSYPVEVRYRDEEPEDTVQGVVEAVRDLQAYLRSCVAAAGDPAAGGVGAVEPVEHVGQKRGGDPDARVCNLKSNPNLSALWSADQRGRSNCLPATPFVHDPCAHGNAATWRILHGIPKQVHDNLAQVRRISTNTR